MKKSLLHQEITSSNLKKKNKTLSIYLFVADISLVLMSIFALIFTANYVGVICLILSTLLVLSRLKITIKNLNCK